MNAIILVLIVISGTTVAVDSKNTSEQQQQQKLAEFQKHEPTHSREQCTSEGGTFSPYDYAVVIAMLAISLKIGVFYGFLHKGSSLDSSDFMLGSQMGLIPVTISLTTSFITAIELLGNPAEMFFFGSQFSLIGKRFVSSRVMFDM